MTAIAQTAPSAASPLILGEIHARFKLRQALNDGAIRHFDEVGLLSGTLGAQRH
jgi:hypothetical protein